MKFFKEDTKTAFEAISQAQQIAFAPIVFQATKALRDLGILKLVEDSGIEGVFLEDVFPKLNLFLHFIDKSKKLSLKIFVVLLV